MISKLPVGIDRVLIRFFQLIVPTPSNWLRQISRQEMHENNRPLATDQLSPSSQKVKIENIEWKEVEIQSAHLAGMVKVLN